MLAQKKDDEGSQILRNICKRTHMIPSKKGCLRLLLLYVYILGHAKGDAVVVFKSIVNI
jgi:hypothetical protein